jgi:hypothetical protein
MRAIAKTAEHNTEDYFTIWAMALGVLAGTFLALAI